MIALSTDDGSAGLLEYADVKAMTAELIEWPEAEPDDQISEFTSFS